MAELNHDTALVRAFIAPERRHRYLGLLASERGRAKLRRALAHCGDLDYRFARELPQGIHTPSQIAAFLRERGAPADCVLISEDEALDGRHMPLMEALDAVVGRGMGAFVSCIPGRLAFYEGEGPAQRYVLERAT